MLKFINRILFGGTYKVAHIDSTTGKRKVFWCDTWQGLYLHNGVNMSTSEHYTIYGPAGLTIDVCGTAEKVLSKASQHYTINPLRVRQAVKTLERDGLFGYSCGMDYIVVERVNP